MADITPQVATLLTASGGVLGSIVMWAHNRRSGKLTLTQTHMNYINEQQADIDRLTRELTAMRSDFSDLWRWALDATHKAAGIVDLGDLPRQRPRSADPETKG